MTYATQELRDVLGHVEITTTIEAIRLRSANYLAIGCDLNDTVKLNEVLQNEFDLANCLVLCIAEVSVTYMDVQAADALISWAACLGSGSLAAETCWNQICVSNYLQCDFVFLSNTCRKV